MSLSRPCGTEGLLISLSAKRVTACLHASNSSHASKTDCAVFSAVGFKSPSLGYWLLIYLFFSPCKLSSGATDMQEELPPYDCASPLPGYITSRGLASPIETVSLLSSGSQAGEYSYKSDHLHINLGPRRWGTRFPVYGFQDVVEGTVQVAKKCSHVVSVTAAVSPLWS